MQAEPASAYLGKINVISIGVPLKLLQAFDVPGT
jgi:hypothetical protein